MPAAVHLREPNASDARDFVALAARSRALHGAWTKAPGTKREFLAYLDTLRSADHFGFLVCRTSDDALMGVVNNSNVVLGVFRSGYLGYYAFSGCEGQGFMSAGLRLVIRRAFTSMRLHRLEANIQPGNLPSIALVRACGFVREGYSPRYLKINGRWRDHERWAIIAT